jgi:hypothetical protein
LLGGVEASLKHVLTQVFQYVLPNGRFGPISHQQKVENFQAYYVNSTTATSTGEFTVVHGMGRTPYLALMALNLASSGSKTPVLTVSRPADGMRIYVKADAGSTNAPFTLYLE